jgi:hypothetical protein
MTHLTKNDLVLFATHWQKLSENMESKNIHISTCPDCKTQLDKITQVLNSYRILNKQQCNQCFTYLFNFLNQGKKPALDPDLQTHLDSCKSCRQFFQMATIESPIDFAQNLNLKISPDILNQLDTKVYAALEKLAFTNYLTQTVISLKNQLADTVHIIELFLVPAPELIGTRGKDDSDYYIFTHKGGKIQLQVGLANTDVKLFGIFKDKIFSNKTDLKGNVLFDDLPKDDYRVEVKGYDVSLIKTIN